ncbi:MAG: hypothetical protein KDK51_02515 [Deltaproteobacteria bacterium]|nr:hypothetical protein [Deltaproteobacteria bacterium]
MKNIIMAALALSLFACGPAKVGSNPSPIQNEQHLLLLDRAYKPYLKVVSEKTRRLESGQLEVIMEIQNKRNKDLWADIQVVFKDSDGVEVDKTNWEPKMFHRREVTTFKKISLPVTAADYRVVIRKAKSES